MKLSKITKRGAKRLGKLAHFLETIHPSKFNLNNWVLGPDPYKMSEEPTKKGTCGTAACAIGWLPRLFPRSWEWSGDYIGVFKRNRNTPSDTMDDAATFFGITHKEVLNLFSPFKYKSNNVQASTVARRIFRLLEDVENV